MVDLEAFGIPEEEWSLLTNALSEPVEQLIAIESKDKEQLAEVERRLLELVGPRPLLRQVVDLNTLGEPETVWKTAELLVEPFAGEIPLLVVVIAIWPEQDDVEARQPLAAFWRGMNQLRELWHSLSAQVLFLLSPIAYKHLSLNADHLKRWISLKLRLWEGSTDLEVLARPGKYEVSPTLRFTNIENDNVRSMHLEGSQQLIVPLNSINVQSISFVPRNSIGVQSFSGNELKSSRLEILGLQLKEAIRRGESKADQVKRYYLPMIVESLAIGDRQGAKELRENIGGLEGLGQRECEALKKLDEQLTEPTIKPRFDVFISYCSQDRYIVREMVSTLYHRGLNVWFDQEQLRPGIPWQAALEDILHHSACVAVLIGKEGLGQWQREEMKAALNIVARDNRPIIPVLLPNAPDNPVLPPILANRAWVDMRQGITEAKINQLVWGITGKKLSVTV